MGIKGGAVGERLGHLPDQRVGGRGDGKVQAARLGPTEGVVVGQIAGDQGGIGQGGSGQGAGQVDGARVGHSSSMVPGGFEVTS